MSIVLRLGLFVLVGLFSYISNANAEGAYRVEITKTEKGDVTVVTEPINAQTVSSDLSQTTSVTQTATAAQVQVRTPSKTWSPTGTYYTSQGSYYESGSGALSALIQILALVGDFGLSGGYGYWHAPLSTRFVYQGSELWNAYPTLPATHLGLNINVPVFTFLEFEPYLGLMFGETRREKSLPAGYVIERLLLNETQYGLTCLFPIAQRFFGEIGFGGTVTTLTTDLETTLPAFKYTGFILEHTNSFQLTFGSGLTSPPDWNVRLRGGLQAYQQFADFGTSWGMRVYMVFMFSNKRHEYSTDLETPSPELR